MLKNHRTVTRLTPGRFLLLIVAAAVPMGLALAAEPPAAERGSRSQGQKLSSRGEGWLVDKQTSRKNGRAGDWKRQVFRLNNTPATDAAQTINDLLRGEWQADPKASITVVVSDPITNSIIVAGASADVDQVAQPIEQLDEAPKKVEIQMLIARVTSARGGSPASSEQAPERLERVVDLGVLDDLVSIASIEKRLTELKKSNRLKILGRPRIMTIDNQSAFIQTGIHDAMPHDAMPHDAKSLPKGRSVRPDRQDVGLTVGVTPRIGSNGTVVMEIDVDVSELESTDKRGQVGDSSSGEKARSPRIVTTRAQTTISVPEGRTVVLGGVMATPFAPDEELLIILTPRIVQLEAAPEAQRGPLSR